MKTLTLYTTLSSFYYLHPLHSTQLCLGKTHEPLHSTQLCPGGDTQSLTLYTTLSR